MQYFVKESTSSKCSVQRMSSTKSPPKMPKLGSRIKAGFGRTIREYAETSTTHGISYVFEDGQPRFERALWLILTATCVVLAITLSVLAYQDWQDNPVVTYVSTTALPIENISFPSVTICGQGLIQEVVSTAIMKKFGYFVESKGKVLADLTSTSKADLYDQYLKEKYNGLDPKDIIFSMALPDPDNAVASSVISGQVQEPVSGQLGYCLIITASDNPDEECEVDDTTSFPQPSQLFKAKEMENFGTHSHIGTYYSDTEKGDKLDVFGYFSLHEGHETSINPLIEVTKSEEIQSLLSKMPCQNARKNTFACFVDEDFQAELKNPIKAKKTEERIPPRVDKLLNPESKAKLAADIDVRRNQSLANFQNLNLTASYRDFFEILWYSQLPCFDVQGTTSRSMDEKSMVKRCFWKGLPINCALIFKTFPTDRGMCCTFNMEKAEVMFQKNRYSRMVTRMQEDDFIGSFGGPELPSWYTNNHEPKSKSGKFKGLTLVLDAHTDVVSAGTVSEDFQGFLGLVEENSQFPLVKERSFLIQPGHVTYAAISATGIIASDAIQSVSPVTRNCYFPNEFELQVHSNYSRANCLLECSMDYARNKLEEKCIPWYFPTTDEQAKPCDPWLTKQFLNIMEQIPDETCSYCLPDCEGTVYQTTTTTAPFRRCDVKNLGNSQLCSLDLDSLINPPIWSSQVSKDYQMRWGFQPDYANDGIMTNERRYVARSAIFEEQDREQGVYDAYEKDIAVVHFYFTNPTVFQFTRDASMTMLDYVSQIGGLLGLFIGFSVISGAEILYWLTFRLARNQRKALKVDHGGEDNDNDDYDDDVPDMVPYYPFEQPIKPVSKSN